MIEAKADQGKVRPTLVPASLVMAVAAIREYGCKKYKDPNNWRKVEPQRYLWHMACNVAFLIELEVQEGAEENKHAENSKIK